MCDSRLTFRNYLAEGDVVGCYLAMENGWVDISYSVNGRYCGSAFKIRWMTDEVVHYYFHLINSAFAQFTNLVCATKTTYLILHERLRVWRILCVCGFIDRESCN